jgi:hypothetical protein
MRDFEGLLLRTSRFECKKNLGMRVLQITCVMSVAAGWAWLGLRRICSVAASCVGGQGSLIDEAAMLPSVQRTGTKSEQETCIKDLQ